MRGGQGPQGMQGPAMRGRGRGGFQPGRPTPGKKDTLKFDDDYDFEKANDQFQEIVNKLSRTKIDDAPADGQENGEEEAAVVEGEGEELEVAEEGEIPEGEDDEIYYDKKKSFFDNISCEALERSKGNMVRNDWKAEKKLNKETFGVAGNRRYGYGGGRGGFYQNRGGRGMGGFRGKLCLGCQDFFYHFNNPGGYGGGGGGGYRGGYRGENTISFNLILQLGLLFKEAMEVRMETESSVVEVMEALEAEVLKALTTAGAEAEEDTGASVAEVDLGEWAARETGWVTEGDTPLP